MLLFIVFLLISCTNEVDFLKYFSSTVEIICRNEEISAFATGTIISNDGKILTNKHVVSLFAESTINVKLNDEQMYEASIVRMSSEFDLALLKINASTKGFMNLQEDFKIGEEIYGIGNPQGLGLSLYKGIITSNYKKLNINNEKILSVQTNIEFDDGASGGPIFNQKGELLGIMTFRLKNINGYVPGVSFIISSISLKQFINEEEIL